MKIPWINCSLQPGIYCCCCSVTKSCLTVTLHRTSPDGQYPNQIDYIHCSCRWRRSIQTAKTRPRADCGSDHELLIAKFRFKLKKVGIITWRRQWHPTPVLFPGKSHGWRSLVGCSPRGR